MPYFPLPGLNHLQLKFYTIMQNFKRVLDFDLEVRRVFKRIFSKT